MKKVLLVVGIFSLLISGCQFITIELPTPSAPAPVLTSSPEFAVTVSPKNTVTLQATIIVSESPFPVQMATPSPLPLPSITPTSQPLSVQTGSPAYIQNYVHSDAGCAWLGIAGQIFDANNQPVMNLVVNVKGMLGPLKVDKIAVTGIPEANVYGPGGYEVKIADKAIASENTMTVQVFDLNGYSLSKPISFNTFSECSKNLIIINFHTK